MVETADVIVIGAGVQGASLAFHLARRGARPSSSSSGAPSRPARPVGRAVSSGCTTTSSPDARNACESPSRGSATGPSGSAATAASRPPASSSIVGPAKADLLAGERRGPAGDRDPDRGRDGRPDPRAGAGPRGGRRRGRRPTSRTPATPIRRRRPPASSGRPATPGRGLVQGAEVLAIPTSGGARHRRRDEPRVVLRAGRRERGRRLGGAGRGPRRASTIPIGVWRHDIAYLGAPPSVPVPFPVVIDDVNAMYFRPEGSELVLVGLEDHTGKRRLARSRDRRAWSPSSRSGSPTGSSAACPVSATGRSGRPTAARTA